MRLRKKRKCMNVKTSWYSGRVRVRGICEELERVNYIKDMIEEEWENRMEEENGEEYIREKTIDRIGNWRLKRGWWMIGMSVLRWNKKVSNRINLACWLWFYFSGGVWTRYPNTKPKDLFHLLWHSPPQAGMEVPHLNLSHLILRITTLLEVIRRSVKMEELSKAPVPATWHGLKVWKATISASL